MVPIILGFDPRYQFVHEDDVVAALAHVLHDDLPGVFNVGADGVLALTEVIDLLGKRLAPVLPPWGTGLAAAALRRLGIEVSPEMLEQLRFGRGLDNRRLKATGFEYRYTTRETVIGLGEHIRLAPIMRGAAEPYRYEREVEEFLRRSPHVRTHPRRRGAANGEAIVLAAATLTEDTEIEDAGSAPPVAGYEDLEAEEIAALLESLEPEGLATLRDHEHSTRARPEVLTAIDDALARAGDG